jgi:hypothetical protein
MQRPVAHCLATCDRSHASLKGFLATRITENSSGLSGAIAANRRRAGQSGTWDAGNDGGHEHLRDSRASAFPRYGDAYVGCE